MEKRWRLLTHHKKSVRTMALHPKENAFASASADNTNKLGLPKGEFCHNMLSQQMTIINVVAGVMVIMEVYGSGTETFVQPGLMEVYGSGTETFVQPGSLEGEAGIYAACYDQTGSRLVTCEADKTIKMSKEDENATPETHPVNFKPPKDIRRFY
ncbi:hypothetical protein F2Q69_00034490 [Brassica cretica]|uniref:Uncharacterized protein n=1 Tax=Brassica cretica TaxID=69181 RepID=A0A8S9SN43_BRACR|nr:hypothetical protein F2Q69_00034490 [Brassica cretica]